MTCNRIATDLDDFLDGHLDPEAAAELERHVAECPACQATLRHAQALLAAVRAQSVPGPSERFFERALAEATKPRPRGRQSARIVAAGFLGAFAATILTVIVTGLWVGAPRSRAPETTPEVAMSLHETKTVNLVFAAKNALGDVAMRVQ